MDKKTAIILIIVVAIILIAVAAIFYIKPWGLFKKELQGFGVGVDFNLGIDMEGIGRGTENVLKNMPSTNPLEGVANPFRDAYKNPFE